MLRDTVYNKGSTNNDRENIVFNVNSDKVSKRRWLYYNKLSSVNNGYNVTRESTITCIVVSSKNDTVSCDFSIVNIKDDTILYSTTLENNNYKKIDNLSISLNEADRISVIIDVGNNTIDYPQIEIKICSNI